MGFAFSLIPEAAAASSERALWLSHCFQTAFDGGAVTDLCSLPQSYPLAHGPYPFHTCAGGLGEEVWTLPFLPYHFLGFFSQSLGLAVRPE